MHPAVLAHHQALAQKHEARGPFLEIGAGPLDDAVLAGKYFEPLDERHAVNVIEHPQREGIAFHRANANDMRDLAADQSVGTVISNAMLEHDRQFWLTLGEVRRILKPGGLFIVGVPGFVPMHDLDAKVALGQSVAPTGPSTLVFDVHDAVDYWRFSREAVNHVIFEGLDVLEIEPILVPPRLLGASRKPSLA